MADPTTTALEAGTVYGQHGEAREDEGRGADEHPINPSDMDFGVNGYQVFWPPQLWKMGSVDIFGIFV